MASNIYKIGTTFGGLTLLTSLSTPITNPYSDFAPYSRPHSLANGGIRGNGSPVLQWSWKFMTRTQRNYLRTTFCPSPANSASVYIAQLDGEGTERAFLCKLLWPAKEEVQAERVLDFSLVFRRLEIVTS